MISVQIHWFTLGRISAIKRSVNETFIVCLYVVYMPWICKHPLLAQDDLSKLIYNIEKSTPIPDHDSLIVPGVIVEVPITGNNRWLVLQPSQEQLNAKVTQGTGQADAFEVAKPVNIKIGISGFSKILAGASIGGVVDAAHTYSVSGIDEQKTALADGEAERLVGTKERKSGYIYNKLISDYDNHKVAYFLVNSVKTAKYAEMSTDEGVKVAVAIGAKDTGSCTAASLPSPITSGDLAKQTPGAGTPASAAPAAAAPAATAPAAANSPSVGVTFCRPNLEHVRFSNNVFVPISMELLFIGKPNSTTLDFDYGSTSLPTWDIHKTRGVALAEARHFYH